MEIVAAGIDGSLKSKATEEGAPRFCLRLPVQFRDLNHGPQGIQRVEATNLCLGGQKLRTSGQVVIYGLDNGEDEPTCIESRPVGFRTEVLDTNTLIFGMEGRASAGVKLSSLTDDDAVQVTLRIYFLENVVADVRAFARVQEADSTLLEVSRIESVPDPRRSIVLQNFAGLLVLIAGLTYWNRFVNVSVHDAGLFRNSNIAFFIGLVIGFFGFPAKNLLKYVSSWSVLLSVIRSPELHFDYKLFRTLSSSALRYVLILLIAATAAVIYYYHPIRIGDHDRFAVYDFVENQPVVDDRIRQTDIRSEEWRFGLYPVTAERLPEKFAVGYLNSDGSSQFLPVRINYFQGSRIREPNDSFRVLATRLGEDPNVRKYQLSLDTVLRMDKRTKTFRLRGYAVTLHPYGNRPHFLRAIDIRDKQLLQEQDVKKVLAAYQSHGSFNQDYSYWYRDRYQITGDLYRTGRPLIDTARILDVSTLVRYTLREINNIPRGILSKPDEKCIKAGVVLNALWSTFARPIINESPSRPQLDSIYTAIGQTIRANHGWNQNRCLLELLLTLHTMFPGPSGKAAMRTIRECFINPAEAKDRQARLDDVIALLAAKELTPRHRVVQQLYEEYPRLPFGHGKYITRGEYIEWLKRRELNHGHHSEQTWAAHVNSAALSDIVGMYFS
ncbi:hypothetical protein [Lewinella sp. JB7]|uniref:hypothetical protein n=1 Tax=Lewinella sp. JB7 TaxID=2962887 RepID=UPI0020C942A6|nr:hypothetical protein [Lewinella sp. JB7]MCP9236923.1 hypothetical protein [Lewinella sp. JB7]